MSGHSKWSKIQRGKAISDQKKGVVFSKLGRQIAIAVREGGNDPSSNFKLRLVIEKAREAEMPKDNIERAIAKAAGGGGDQQIEQATYEGFGPFGTTFVVEAATDNKNRATANIRHLLEKFGGSMGQPGSVVWGFETKGQILVQKNGHNAEDVELAAIDAGAEDVKTSEQGVEIYTTPLDLKNIKQALEKISVKIASAEIVMHPKTPTELTPEQKEKVQALFEALSEDEEVIAVHTSANL
ncbi:MAG: YebC/PmpR family DNA-binding transcriptional regulator [bacterium]|nr:YebC/PmpR family DNA-binding transcriptional regulator [bacterium]